MRILVVEDDKKITSFVVKGLKEAGFAVECADNGEDGLRMALKAPYDAAVIDVMLPMLDGLSIIERLRTEKIFTPVLILSAKRSVDDRVKGLQTGGDDYLTKPFSFSELLVRVQALIRRSSQRIADRRRRLFDQAVFLQRASGPRASADPPRGPRSRADPPGIRRSFARFVEA